jgi:hypothetical protein
MVTSVEDIYSWIEHAHTTMRGKRDLIQTAFEKCFQLSVLRPTLADQAADCILKGGDGIDSIFDPIYEVDDEIHSLSNALRDINV